MRTKFKIVMFMIAVVLFSGVFTCNAQTIPITPGGPTGAALVYDIVNGKWVRLAADTDGSVFTAAATWADDSPLYSNIASPNGAMFVYDTTNAVWRAATGSADGSLATSGGGGGGDFTDGGQIVTDEMIIGSLNPYNFSMIASNEIYLKADTTSATLLAPKGIAGDIVGNVTGDLTGNVVSDTVEATVLELPNGTAAIPSISFPNGTAEQGFFVDGAETIWSYANKKWASLGFNGSTGSYLKFYRTGELNSTTMYSIADKGLWFLFGSSTTPGALIKPGGMEFHIPGLALGSVDATANFVGTAYSKIGWKLNVSGTGTGFRVINGGLDNQTITMFDAECEDNDVTDSLFRAYKTTITRRSANDDLHIAAEFNDFMVDPKDTTETMLKYRSIDEFEHQYLEQKVYDQSAIDAATYSLPTPSTGRVIECLYKSNAGLYYKCIIFDDNSTKGVQLL